MSLTLTASIIQCTNMSYTGWIEEINGVVAQGDSLEEVKSELLKVLHIKLKLELGIGKNDNIPHIALGNTGNLITQHLNLVIQEDDITTLQA